MNGTALITGASTGIGAELARVFARHGHELVLVARNQERLSQVSSELEKEFKMKSRVLALDLSDPDAPARLYEELAGDRVEIDILVNNAGFGLRGAFASTDFGREAEMIRLNVTALTHLTKLFLPDMLARRRGKILNVASTAAFVPGPLMAVYYATKAYVLSFSEALAAEVKGSGVSVTVLCPGPTRTQFEVTAGTSNTRLFRKAVMDAPTVARVAYDGLMNGRTVVIPGFRNQLIVQSTRMAPRSVTARIAKALNT
jgi:short-subunit dehydrogenase